MSVAILIASPITSRASTRLRRAGYFSLLAQREVTKRNAPPARASRAARARGSLRFSALRGRSDGTSMYRSRVRRSIAAPLRALSTKPAMLSALKGDPRSKTRSRSTSRSTAIAAFLARCCLLFASGFCGRECRPNGAPVGRRGCVGKAAGWRARCAPVRCVHMGEADKREMRRSASRAAERRSHGWRRPGFARGAGSAAGKVHSANPVAASRTRRAGCPESAPPGWPSLWLLSLGHPRESDSLAAGE